MNSSITRFVIVGESSASPDAITWIAATSCSGWRVLEQEAARARAQRLVDVLVEVEGREHQHPEPGVPVADEPARRLEPVEVRHPDVHQDHVRRMLARRIERLQPVARLPDDLDPRLGLEDHPEAGAHERLVVHDQDSNRHQADPATGSRAEMVKPPPSRGPAVRSPP